MTGAERHVVRRGSTSKAGHLDNLLIFSGDLSDRLRTFPETNPVDNYVFRYKGYIVDFTPFDAGAGTYGARWAIAKDDAIWSGSVPLSTAILGARGTREEMAELGRSSATQLIDRA